MPPGPVASGRLAALLRELGPRLRASSELALQEAPARRPSGIPALDGLLGGGFPCGRLSTIAGPASSGCTSLAVALLAATTRAGESAALVDVADAFDPASAAAAGADLSRTLWARAARAREALRAAELLLQARGFALVLVDLPAGGERLPDARWQRLARAAAGSTSALVVLTSGARAAGRSAELALELRPARARFGGRPALLEALETEAVLVRRRGGAPGGVAALRFQGPE